MHDFIHFCHCDNVKIKNTVFTWTELFGARCMLWMTAVNVTRMVIMYNGIYLQHIHSHSRK